MGLLNLAYLILSLLIPAEIAHVTAVTDGDTFVTNTGKVRMIGINAPERGQACYHEARVFLENLVLNKTVWLERDLQNKDHYDRLLRYVFIDGQNLNELLVANGLAKSYFISPNMGYEQAVKQAEYRVILQANGCLWKPSNEFCIALFQVNHELEWAELVNICNQEKQLAEWRLEDTGNDVIFINTSICAGCKVRINSACGKSGYLCNIWDSHDTAYLFAPDGFVDYKSW
ncbi:MAG: thermonuclease family protein [Candidatus Altiarchaeota archaeon]|nr:thermonuclease family protein [Candidatus Altiarchaeota archaeon]